jgi:hypothetical protein
MRHSDEICKVNIGNSDDEMLGGVFGLFWPKFTKNVRGRGSKLIKSLKKCIFGLKSEIFFMHDPWFYYKMFKLLFD